MQSAYKKHQSTDTALLKIKSDILQNFEDCNVTCLVLLDSSVTFNKVNHKILLQRLQTGTEFREYSWNASNHTLMNTNSVSW